MRFHSTAAFLTLILCFVTANEAAAQAKKNPTFAQYAAKKMTSKIAAVDLKSHRQANEYRTRLRDAAKSGVNFAGNFVIATWGCGTRCGQGAVIDAKTGAVYFPDELGVYSRPWGDWAGDKETLEYKANSRLLILRGKTGADDDREGIYYFEWTGKSFKKIKFVEVKPEDEQ